MSSSSPATAGTDNKSLYKALDLTPDASPAQIKSAYRRLALQYHPDKNPDGGERFREINHAWEILSDPKMKQIYDRYGEQGLQMANQLGEFAYLATDEGESLILALLCVATAFLVVVALFIIFLCLRIDKNITWPWAVVFIPLWIVDSFALFFIISRYFCWSNSKVAAAAAGDSTEDVHQEDSGNGTTFAFGSGGESSNARSDNNEKKKDADAQSVGTNSKEKKEMSPAEKAVFIQRIFGVYRTIQFSLIMAFQILIIMRLEGNFNGSMFWVFLPWFIMEGFWFLQLSVEFVMTVSLLNAVSAENNAIMTGITSISFGRRILNGLYAFYVVFKYWLLRIWLAVFICLRVDLVIAANWFFIFMPIFIKLGIFILTPYFICCTARRNGSEEERARFSMGVAQATANTIIGTLALVMVCLLAARLNVELPELSYSMAVIFIPIFIVLGISMCCSCCFLPCMVIGMFLPDPRANPGASQPQLAIEL